MADSFYNYDTEEEEEEGVDSESTYIPTTPSSLSKVPQETESPLPITQEDPSAKKPLGSYAILDAKASAILEAAPSLEIGMAALRKEYATHTWDKPNEAAQLTAAYSASLKQRFHDQSGYDLASLEARDGSGAPVSFADIIEAKNKHIAETGQEPQNDLSEYDVSLWESSNNKFINESTDVNTVLNKSKLLEGVKATAFDLHRRLKTGDTSSVYGTIKDSINRVAGGMTGGLSTLVGIEDPALKHTMPDRDKDLSSDILSGIGTVIGVAAASSAGPTGTAAALTGFYGYMGAQGIGAVKETYKQAMDVTYDTKEAVKAATAEGLAQVVLAGGMKAVLRGPIAKKGVDTLRNKIAEYAGKNFLANLGWRAAVDITTGELANTLTNVSKNIANGDDPLKDLTKGMGRTAAVFGTLGVVVGTAAKAVDIIKPNPLVVNDGKVPLREEHKTEGKVDTEKTAVIAEHPTATDDANVHFTTEDGNKFLINDNDSGSTVRINSNTGEAYYPLDRTHYVEEDVAAKLAVLKSFTDVEGNPIQILTNHEGKLMVKSPYVTEDLMLTDKPTGRTLTEVPVTARTIGVHPVEANKPRNIVNIEGTEFNAAEATTLLGTKEAELARLQAERPENLTEEQAQIYDNELLTAAREVDTIRESIAESKLSPSTSIEYRSRIGSKIVSSLEARIEAAPAAESTHTESVINNPLFSTSPLSVGAASITETKPRTVGKRFAESGSENLSSVFTDKESGLLMDRYSPQSNPESVDLAEREIAAKGIRQASLDFLDTAENTAENMVKGASLIQKIETMANEAKTSGDTEAAANFHQASAVLAFKLSELATTGGQVVQSGVIVKKVIESLSPETKVASITETLRQTAIKETATETGENPRTLQNLDQADKILNEEIATVNKEHEDTVNAVIQESKVDTSSVHDEVLKQTETAIKEHENLAEQRRAEEELKITATEAEADRLEKEALAKTATEHETLKAEHQKVLDRITELEAKVKAKKDEVVATKERIKQNIDKLQKKGLQKAREQIEAQEEKANSIKEKQVAKGADTSIADKQLETLKAKKANLSIDDGLTAEERQTLRKYKKEQEKLDTQPVESPREEAEIKELKELTSKTEGTVKAGPKTIEPKIKLKIDNLRKLAAQAKKELATKAPEDLLQVREKKTLLKHRETKQKISDLKAQELKEKQKALSQAQQDILKKAKERRDAAIEKVKAKKVKLADLRSKLQIKTDKILAAFPPEVQDQLRSLYADKAVLDNIGHTRASEDLAKKIDKIQTKALNKAVENKSLLYPWFIHNLISGLDSVGAEIKGDVSNLLAMPIAVAMSGKIALAGRVYKGAIREFSRAKANAKESFLTGKRTDTTEADPLGLYSNDDFINNMQEWWGNTKIGSKLSPRVLKAFAWINGYNFRSFMGLGEFFRTMSEGAAKEAIAGLQIYKEVKRYNAITKQLKKGRLDEKTRFVLQNEQELLAKKYPEGKLTARTLQEKISNMLHNSDKEWADAMEQATKIASSLTKKFTPKEIKDLAYDIIQAKIDPVITEEAMARSKQSMYMGPISGPIGKLTEALQMGLKTLTIPIIKNGKIVYEVPVGLYLQPFLRISGHMADFLTAFDPLVSGPIRTFRSTKTVFGRKESGSFGLTLVKKTNLERTMDVGRWMTGLSIFGGFAAYLMATKDDPNATVSLLGAKPTNPTEAAMWEARKLQPWSIKIGDTMIRFSEIPMLAAPLSMLSGMIDYHKANKLNKVDDNALEMLAYGLLGEAKVFSDFLFLRNIQELIDIARTPTGNNATAVEKILKPAKKAIKSITANVAKGFIPLVSMQHFVTRMYNTPQNTRDLFIAGILKDTVFASSTSPTGAPEQVGMFGESLEGDMFDKMAAIGRNVYFERADPQYLWLAQNNYRIPNPNRQVLSASEKALNVKRHGPEAVGDLTTWQKVELAKQAGPELRELVRQMQQNYGNVAGSKRIQDILTNRSLVIMHRWKKKLFLN